MLSDAYKYAFMRTMHISYYLILLRVNPWGWGISTYIGTLKYTCTTHNASSSEHNRTHVHANVFGSNLNPAQNLSKQKLNKMVSVCANTLEGLCHPTRGENTHKYSEKNEASDCWTNQIEGREKENYRTKIQTSDAFGSCVLCAKNTKNVEGKEKHCRWCWTLNTN